LNSLAPILRCPRCGGAVVLTPSPRCGSGTCRYSEEGFPSSAGQPVLIDFDNSIFTPDVFVTETGTVIPRGEEGSRVGRFLDRLTYGTNHAAAAAVDQLVAGARAVSEHPRVLVIGGGSVGGGLAALYEAEGIEIVGTDVYASLNTVLVCDGHSLPFADASFEGVVIQAVLEHVLSPAVVAEEIFRVLKPQGVVYADTPFMQQVHEGAYDFTRFTMSGHRWLFRRFEEISAGAVAGPGIALLWSISYFVRALGLPRKVQALITALFFWVRLLERQAETRGALDGASSTYFLGRKGAAALAPRDIPAYYEAQRHARGTRPGTLKAPETVG
jgi:SAM-dependent methyltransferase